MVKISKLETEKRNPDTMNLDEMETLEILSVMNKEDKHVVRAVEQALPQIAEIIAFTAESLEKGGRIIYIGAGTSGRIGVLDAVECPPTFGVSEKEVVGMMAGGESAFVKAAEGMEDNVEQGAKDLENVGLNPNDTVIGLTASGRTPYVIGALRYASSVGSKTAAISCNMNARVSELVMIAVEVDTGPEILAGSTRLKAGTAEKMILNMISTASMVKNGKVYQNLMVDLKQTNEKLVSRAEHIVMQATGCEKEQAKLALRETEGNVKQAIVSLLLEIDWREAEQLLSRANGKVRKAVEMFWEQKAEQEEGK